jgi:hypothetical protein
LLAATIYQRNPDRKQKLMPLYEKYLAARVMSFTSSSFWIKAIDPELPPSETPDIYYTVLLGVRVA